MIATRGTRIERADLSKDVVAHYAAPRRRPADVWHDSSPNKQHGTLTLMNTPDVWEPSPFGGWALQFDGVNDYVDLNRGWAFTDFSFACWFRVPNLTTDHGIAGNWTGAALHNGFRIWFDNIVASVGGTDAISFVIFGDALLGNWTWIRSSSLPAAGWYHVGVTRQNGVDARMFINGQYDTPATRNLARPLAIDGTSNVLLGTAITVSAGTMTEVMLWERTISDSEMHDHYLRTRPQPHARRGAILSRTRATRRFTGVTRVPLDLSGDFAVIDGKVNITLNGVVINDVVMLQSKQKEGDPSEGAYLHRETTFQLPTTAVFDDPKVGDTVTVAEVSYTVLDVREPFLGDFWGLKTREVSITADETLQDLITLFPAVHATDAGGFTRTTHPSASADFTDVPGKVQPQSVVQGRAAATTEEVGAKRGFKKLYAIYVSAELPTLKHGDLMKDQDSKQYTVESWTNRQRIDELSIIVCSTPPGS